MPDNKQGNVPADYYKDHWLHVEPERRARYEAMFQWRDSAAPLISAADLQPGQVVADFGCGPGGLALELARRVGDNGNVIALDINAGFLETVRKRAEAEGVSKQITTTLLAGDVIPLPDASVDRVLCKNVLEYVPDPALTIAEFARVLKPGGIAHAIDSDWGAFMYEPDGAAFAQIMSGAAVAFRTPLIGRQLYGLFRAAGLSDISVHVQATPDTQGGLRSVLTNMAGYAAQSGQVDATLIEAFTAGFDQALESQTWFSMLPQFLVTGHKAH